MAPNKAIAVVALVAVAIAASASLSDALSLRAAVQAKAQQHSSEVLGCLLGGACPEGPYTSVCGSCYTDNLGELHCKCLNQDGALVDSSLQNAFACNQNVNADAQGQLQCSFPQGNYYESCQQCYLDSDNKLVCICFDSVGYPQDTELESVSTCSFVENVNGKLTCADVTASPTPETPAPTEPTASPTEPTASPTTCFWSDNTRNGESTPAATCDSKANEQGCMYNNYCCWVNNDCSTVSGCPECPFQATQASCLASIATPTGRPCCDWHADTGTCTRACQGRNTVVCGV